MRVPFLIPTLGLTIGILAAQGQALLMPKPLPLFIILFLVPMLWAFRNTKRFVFLLFCVMALIGFYLARSHERLPLTDISRFLDYPSMSLEGVIVSDPILKTRGKKKTLSFVIKSENLVRWIKRERRREYFDVQGRVQVFAFQPSVTPKFGDRIRMRGRLEEPKPVLNPGGFDYGKYLKQQGITCLFKSYGQKGLTILESNQLGQWNGAIHRLRMMLERKIEALFQTPSREILKATVLGRRQEITPEMRTAFMKTGTSHLLAISGLHVALVSGTAYLVMILVGIRQRSAALLTLLIILLQVLVSGAGIPVRRAGWMACVSFVAVLLNRERDSFNTFFSAVMMFLVLEPLVLFNLSFQLSFISVLSLILLIKNFHEGWRWSECFVMTAVIFVGTFPIVAFYFNVISFMSLIANVVAIPLFHLSLIGGLLSLLLNKVPILGVSVVWVTEQLVSLALSWIDWLATFEKGYLFLKAPSITHMGIYYGVLLFVVLTWKKMTAKFNFIKYLGLSLWLICVGAFFISPAAGQSSLTLLSAGRNELAHIQFKGRRHWTINTGRGFPSNQARWILEPYLKSKGVNQVGTVLLMGHYQKHIGGLSSFLTSFPIQYLIYPKPKEKGAPRFPRISSKVNQLSLQTSRDIQISDKEDVKVFPVNDQLMFSLKFNERHVLFLPKLNADVLMFLKRHFEYVSTADVVVLPTLSQKTEVYWEELLEYVDPIVMTLPHTLQPLKEVLKQSDIPLLELDQLGALEFTFHSSGKMNIYSYLRGAINDVG